MYEIWHNVPYEGSYCAFTGTREQCVEYLKTRKGYSDDYQLSMVSDISIEELWAEAKKSS